VAAGHDLARGPQGHGLARPSGRQPAEYRFRGDLYSQESTFPLVYTYGDSKVILFHIYASFFAAIV